MKKGGLASKQNKIYAKQIKDTLGEELQKGKIMVQVRGEYIIVRVPTEVFFRSASALLDAQFETTLMKVAQALKKVPGKITVAGHTDSLPIKTQKFRSNWELSSARAVSMAHALMELGPIERMRLTIAGHSDTRPVASNDTSEGRARNRRVEVIVHTTSSDPSKKQ